MLLSFFLATQEPIITDFYSFRFFDPVSFWPLAVKTGLNLVALTIIIRFLYYPKTLRKDYLFTYFLIGFITFFLCLALNKIDIDTGMGLGLFAIFGIIRYRTDAIEIKEMTYLFVVIGVSVVNSLADKQLTIAETAFINISIIAIAYSLEYVFLLKHETRKMVMYERIDLIIPEKYAEMKADLEKRTGLVINRIEVGKINFLNDTAQIRIFYYGDDQAMSDYNGESSGE
jgi:hypothetical protein